jgi:DNA modification methylase
MREGFADSIVTDPPYGLTAGKSGYLGENAGAKGFMGKVWDHGVPGVEFWREALRVAKPGAHLLAMGSTRTFHRLVCAIEDAGWEVRDTVSYLHSEEPILTHPLLWIHGQGFPKSMNVGTAIDKQAGAVREDLGPNLNKVGRTQDNRGGRYVMTDKRVADCGDHTRLTKPATEAAKQWDGWGTALKPAVELICVARKPLEGTVASNVLKYGTGGLNIDGCRIPTEGKDKEKHLAEWDRVQSTQQSKRATYLSPANQIELSSYAKDGRWPANLILDDSKEVQSLFPNTKSGSGNGNAEIGVPGNIPLRRGTLVARTDHGSAARFFYCAKCSTKDHEEGLAELPDSELPLTMGKRCAKCGKWDRPNSQCVCEEPEWEAPKARKNNHPTCKPTDLMRWLVRLVTRPGGVVLDPFMGSGSTGKACALEGMHFIGIDLEPEYVEIARARISAVET